MCYVSARSYRMLFPLVLSVALLNCYENRDPTTGCYVYDVGNWSSRGIEAWVDQPNVCPVLVPSRFPGLVNFDFNVRAPATDVDETAQIRVEFYDALLRLQQILIGGLFGGDPVRIGDVAGQYSPGIAGPMTFVEDQNDNAYATFPLKDGLSAAGRAELPYRYEPRVSVTGPVSAADRSTVTFTANVSNFIDPLTVRWYRDGQYIGTGLSRSEYLSHPGSHTYVAEATDGDGDTGRDTHSIYVSDGTGGGGGGGDGDCVA